MEISRMFRTLTMILIPMLCVSCGHSSHDHDHEQDGLDHETVGEHAHDHEGDTDEINLNPEIAQQMGVKTDTAKVSFLYDSVDGYGVVSAINSESSDVISPISGQIKLRNGIVTGTKVRRGDIIATVTSQTIEGSSENAVAKVEMDNAKREYERQQRLRAEGLSTEGDVARARTEYESAKARWIPVGTTTNISSPISGILLSIDASNGSYVSAGSRIAIVTGSDNVSVVVDLSTQGARMNNGKLVAARRDGEEWSEIAGSSNGEMIRDLNTGRARLTFNIINDKGLIPGERVEVMMASENGKECITVPVSSIIEQQGVKFVYVALDEDCYQKRRIKTGVSNGGYVEITTGLQPGEIYVSSGATIIRLAENSGKIPEGHTHNH